MTIYEMLGLSSPVEEDPNAYYEEEALTEEAPETVDATEEFGGPAYTLPAAADPGLPSEPSSLVEGETGGIPSGMVPHVFGQYGLGRRRNGPIRIPPAPRVPGARTARPRVAKGIGLENWQPGFSDLLFLAFNPQALGLLHAIHGMRQADEDRRMQQEQIGRQNQMQDLQTQLFMDQIGGLPVEEGVVGDFRAGMGGRKKPIETPVGRYSLPTLQQQQEKAKAEFEAQEDIKAKVLTRNLMIREQVKARMEPKIPLASDFVKFFNLHPQTTGLPASVVEKMTAQYNALNKGATIRVIPNNDGTLSIARVDGSTSSVETVPGGPTRSGGAEGFTPYQNYQINKDTTERLEKDIENAAKLQKEAQIELDKAKSLDQSPSGVFGEVTDTQKDLQWNKGIQLAEEAARRYPQWLEGGRTMDGTTPTRYGYVKWKQDAPPQIGQLVPQGAGAGAPQIDAAQQKFQAAMRFYKRMTPEQKAETKNGITYRQWFTRTFKIDPDTVQ